MPLSSPERAALEHGDLDDLLPPSAAAAANNGGGAPPMKLDWSSPLELAADAGYRICSAVSYVYAYAVYSYHHRRTEFVLGGVLLGCSALALSGWLGGPSSSSRGGGRGGYHNPTILHDWSAAESAFDLKLGGIDHWCLRGGDDACRCEDPLVPSARSEAKSWGSAHGRNKQAAADAVQRIQEAQKAAAAAAGPSLPWSSGPYDNEGAGDDGLAWFEDGYQDDWAGYTEDFENYNNNRNRHRRTAAAATQLDVVFLGDSITEQRVGKFYGKDNKTLKSNAKVFRNNYSRENGAKYEGLALGIAGDTAPNLLWRIMHGEMPPDLNPRIWWIGVGTNDLGATQCSEEVTLLGILRVVEEILNRKPDARIVINSILPMSQEKSGILEVTGRKGRTTGRNKRKGPATTVFWPSIKAVNKQLQKFADKHKSVKFFDATDIFTERVGNRLVIDHALIEDGVHPTAAGYKAWDREIIKRIDTILAKDDDAKTAAAAAADYEAQKQQADMDKAAAGDITDDNYDSFDEFSGGYTYDDTMMDDLYFAAQYDEGDDDWLYAGQDTDDWR